MGKPIWPKPTTATVPGETLSCMCTGAKSVIVVPLSTIWYVRERICVPCRDIATLTAGDDRAFPAQTCLLRRARIRSFACQLLVFDG